MNEWPQMGSDKHVANGRSWVAAAEGEGGRSRPIYVVHLAFADGRVLGHLTDIL